MIDRTTKLRWRRKLRRKQRQVEDVSAQAEAGLEQHFFRRLSRLTRVRRFVVSWLLLLGILAFGSLIQLEDLSGFYQDVKPAPGGTYTEGIVGTFTNANPLYATNAADSAASRLVFSSLMQYDEDNRLVPDLAEELKVDDRGVRYEVKIREDVRWHDGKPLTAEDVVFTYETIQNPDARSPLFSSWRGVKIKASGKYSVTFTLPNALTSFKHSLTNGIVPKHLLAGIPADQLRGTRFNTVTPVGSGPFEWDTLEVVGAAREMREERIRLTPNERYYKGVPGLQGFIIRTFRDEQQMLDAYQDGELTAMVGLMNIPEALANSTGFTEYNIPLSGEVMVFFNNNQPPFNDVNVRRALVQAVNVPEAIQTLDHPVVIAKAPLLTKQLGYDPKLAQLPFNIAKAEQALDKAGWRKGSDGIRQKDGKRLSFSLQAQNSNDYLAITGFLGEAWRKIGVEVEVLLQSDTEIQGTVRRHDYQALLYGISVGPDPDVFAYWHSSQADPRSARLNLSEYKSSTADTTLEEGRIRSDNVSRTLRYQSFLKAWRSDAPALALYQPRLLYIVRGKLFNFDPQLLNSPVDRFANVENWMIREEKVIKR